MIALISGLPALHRVAAATASVQNARAVISLTDRQHAALEVVAARAFVSRVIAHLQKHHAGALARHPEGLHRRRVEAGIERARRHGFTWESTITAFVAVMFEVAPNFDEHPAAQAILADKGIPHPFKMKAVAHKLSEQEWEAIARLSDPRAWGDQ